MLNGNSFIDYHDFINPNPVPPNMPLPSSYNEIMAPSPNPMLLDQAFNPSSQLLTNQSKLRISQINGTNIPAVESEANNMNEKSLNTRIHELEQLNAYSIAKVISLAIKTRS